LLKELGDKFKMYGAYLLALDRLLVAKASKKMTGVQKWKVIPQILIMMDIKPPITGR